MIIDRLFLLSGALALTGITSVAALILPIPPTSNDTVGSVSFVDKHGSFLGPRGNGAKTPTIKDMARFIEGLGCGSVHGPDGEICVMAYSALRILCQRNIKEGGTIPAACINVLTRDGTFCGQPIRAGMRLPTDCVQEKGDFEDDFDDDDDDDWDDQDWDEDDDELAGDYNDGHDSFQGEYDYERHGVKDGHIEKRMNVRTSRRIAILNATPYSFRRGMSHEYQLPQWNNDTWPEVIRPGQAWQIAIAKSKGKQRKDTGAEIEYHLEGVSKPMSFRIEYNPERKRDPEVHAVFGENLKTVYSPKGTRINLQNRVTHGGVNFMLAGQECNFVSSDTPVGWMGSRMRDIGNLPLNQVAMPRSHHAGMYQAEFSMLATQAVTLTQRMNIYDQMKHGGARVLDWRPVWLADGRWHVAHAALIKTEFPTLKNLPLGMMGASLQEMIRQINKFNNDYPGELTIIDIHDVEAWDSRSWAGHWMPMGERSLKSFYEVMNKLDHRLSLPDAKSLHELPVSRFIGGGRAGVLIHCPEQWAKLPGFPGPENGFVTQKHLPRTAAWSNKDVPHELESDQVSRLKVAKKARGGPLYDMQWLVTLQGVSNVFPIRGLKPRSKLQWGSIFSGIWRELDEKRYPNWISVDGFDWTGDLRHFVTAINHCLAAKKCGPLNGRVPSFEKGVCQK